jgi:isopentenyl phosphate kinase
LSARSGRWRLDAVKVGGSLLTDKSRLFTPDPDGIERFARAINACMSAGLNVVHIAGGGSFGNAIAHPGSLIDLDAMPAVMRTWRGVLEEIARPVCPAITVRGAAELLETGPSALMRQAERRQSALIMTGDVVRTASGLRLVSSDYLPLWIARHHALRRAVMLTNVPGVIRGGKLVRTFSGPVRGPDFEPRSCPDATGAMGLKVRVLSRLARMGVEGAVCGGDQLDDLVRVLRAPTLPGTVFAPRQIACVRAAS